MSSPAKASPAKASPAKASPAKDAKDATDTHPGERLASFFDSFFKIIAALATFGAGATFAKLVQTPVTPWIDYGYSKISVQTWLALSWLMFVLNLASTSFFSAALSLWRKDAVDWFGREESDKRTVVMWYATFVSFVLVGLTIAAFMFLSLIVTAYTGPVGWAAIAFTAFSGALAVVCILSQSPLFATTIGGPPKKDEFDFMKERQWYGYDTPHRRRHGRGYAGRLTGDVGYRPGYEYGTPERGYNNGYARPDEEYDNGYNGDDVFSEKNDAAIRERYIEDEYLSRRNTIEKPPRFAETPEYTIDLRKQRQIRASGGYRFDATQ